VCVLFVKSAVETLEMPCLYFIPPRKLSEAQPCIVTVIRLRLRLVLTRVALTRKVWR
jgi:hypothetical protein